MNSCAMVCWWPAPPLPTSSQTKLPPTSIIENHNVLESEEALFGHKRRGLSVSELEQGSVHKGWIPQTKVPRQCAPIGSL